MVYNCKTEHCREWKVRAVRRENGDIHITAVEGRHICVAPLGFRSAASTQEWLQKEMPKHMEITKSTTVADIVSQVQIIFAEQIFNIKQLCH